MERLRRKVYKLLDVEPEDRGIEKAANLALLVLILLNVLAVILETVKGLHDEYAVAFDVFEAFSVSVFVVEYVLRVWSCTVNPRFDGAVRGRVRFVLSPMALVDLAAVLPSLIPGGVLDLRFARAVRLFRLVRSLKIARYSQALQTLGNVLRAKKEEVVMTGVAGLVLLVFASSAIYYAEHSAQPAVFSSIPAAMWWGVVTLTTVGYGDIYPVTVTGKMLGSFIAILGIGLFALPAGILAAGFSEEVQRRRKGKRTCPHCGVVLE